MIACVQSDDSHNPRNLKNYFERVFWPKKIGSSPLTKRLYLYTIKFFHQWLERAPTLDDLNDDTCAAFLQHRYESMSANAAFRDRTNLLALSSYAAKKRDIEQFVVLPSIKRAMPTPTAMRPEQFRDLLDSCFRSPGRIGQVRASVWWKAFVLVALLTGERTSAILAIRKEWISADGWLRVPAEVRKGRRKPMVYRLPVLAMSAIEPLMQLDSEKLFEMNFTIHTFYRRWGQLMKEAKLPHGRRWKPQVLRRTFASFLELSGGDATKALAHDSRRTTNQSYLDPTITNQQQPGDEIARMFGLA